MSENAAFIFTALAALAAVWAAWEARNAARSTNNASEAALVVGFLDEYHTDSMSESLRRLRRWKDSNGEDFAEVWLEKLKLEDREAQDVEKSRRIVKGYFVKVSRLYQHDLIRQNVIYAIGYVAGLNIYYDVVDELELALNPGRSPSIVENLQKAFGRYREAAQIEPVGPRST